MPLALQRVSCKETLAHVPGVRVKAPLRSDDSQFLALALQLLSGGKADTGGASTYGAQEGSSGNHGFSSSGLTKSSAFEFSREARSKDDVFSNRNRLEYGNKELQRTA
jgi:hypothetical protein